MLKPAILQRSLKAPHVVPAAVLQRPQEAARAASLHVRLHLRSLKGLHLLANAAAKVVVRPCTRSVTVVSGSTRFVLSLRTTT